MAQDAPSRRNSPVPSSSLSPPSRQTACYLLLLHFSDARPQSSTSKVPLLKGSLKTSFGWFSTPWSDVACGDSPRQLWQFSKEMSPPGSWGFQLCQEVGRSWVLTLTSLLGSTTLVTQPHFRGSKQLWCYFCPWGLS